MFAGAGSNDYPEFVIPPLVIARGVMTIVRPIGNPCERRLAGCDWRARDSAILRERSPGLRPDAPLIAS